MSRPSSHRRDPADRERADLALEDREGPAVGRVVGQGQAVLLADRAAAGLAVARGRGAVDDREVEDARAAEDVQVVAIKEAVVPGVARVEAPAVDDPGAAGTMMAAIRAETRGLRVLDPARTRVIAPAAMGPKSRWIRRRA